MRLHRATGTIGHAAAGTTRVEEDFVKYWVCGLVLMTVGVARAQQAPPASPLLGCGDHPDLQVVCGVRAPEDLELTPDDRYLIVSQYASFRNPGATTDLLLLDLKTRRLQLLPVTKKLLAGWGDPSCAAPAMLMPHGTSLARRRGGAWELFVVNHGGRESVEMYELQKSDGSWALTWHGCMVSKMAFNDVAGLADGSFVGTHPTALNQPGTRTDPSQTRATGWVAKWSVAAGESELPGTRLAYPNGVNASTDGRYLYINGFGTRDVQKYDVAAAKIVGVAKVDFQPDNLTWTPRRELIAAGIKGTRGNCPPDSSTSCIQAFGIARIDPQTMRATPMFDSGARPIISGVSVALQAGDDLYIGAFEGDRVVRMPVKSLAR
jgi:hypothetical protein